MHGLLPRHLEAEIRRDLRTFPAACLLGPRQCGKSTLARRIVAGTPRSLYLDLERPSDLRRLQHPELFLGEHAADLVCLDEIQRVPELFPVLRSLIDEQRRPGRFLCLGSASRELIKQSSESLAGRITFHELTPFLAPEVLSKTGRDRALLRLWLRGGFPESYLAQDDDSSLRWREAFLCAFVERDIPALGLRIAPGAVGRLFSMLAHCHGQTLNLSKLGAALGTSHTALRDHVGLLVRTLVVRELQPFAANVKKRLVKSPKAYLRDVGLLHAQLGVATLDDLLGHPVCGASWEGLVVENVLSVARGFSAGFYRTAQGAEIDLVLQRRGRTIAVECKASRAPEVTPGFWRAIEDVGSDEAWVIAPVRESYPLRGGVRVAPLPELLARLAQIG